MNDSVPEKFCVLPFTHLNLKPQGRVACCWRQHRSIGDYTKTSLNDLWRGKKINEIRETFLKGELPTSCDSCHDLESKGVESTRQRLNGLHSFMSFEELVKNRHQVMPHSIEVRFSNQCNLVCKHCNPQYSSNWFSRYKHDPELRKIYFETGFYDENMLRHFDEQMNDDLPDHVLDEIVETFAPHLGHIVITGGEPLLQKKHFEFLKRIFPYAPQMTLDYNSNLTSLGIGGDSVLSLWKSFKKISLRVSLDGSPYVHSYLRHSSKLKVVERNIQRLQASFSQEKLELLGTMTTSLYNILDLVESVRYFIRLGIYFHASLVQYPKFMRITALPASSKRKVTAAVEKFLAELDHDEAWSLHALWLDPMNKDLNKSQIRHHLEIILNYMNSADESERLFSFVKYNRCVQKMTPQQAPLPEELLFQREFANE